MYILSPSAKRPPSSLWYTAVSAERSVWRVHTIFSSAQVICTCAVVRQPSARTLLMTKIASHGQRADRRRMRALGLSRFPQDASHSQNFTHPPQVINILPNLIMFSAINRTIVLLALTNTFYHI